METVLVELEFPPPLGYKALETIEREGSTALGPSRSTSTPRPPNHPRIERTPERDFTPQAKGASRAAHVSVGVSESSSGRAGVT